MEDINGPVATSGMDNGAARGDSTLSRGMAMGGVGLNLLIGARDLKVQFLNRKGEQYFGCANADLQDRSIVFSDHLDPQDLPRIQDQLERCGRHNEHLNYVIYSVRNHEGVSAPYFLYAEPYNRDAADSEYEAYYLTLLPDISASTIPFVSFNTRELFFSHFACDDFGTFEWYMDMDIVFCSGTLFKIYEIAPQPVSGRFHKSFIHPFDLQLVEHQMQRAIDTGAELNMDYRIITANQSIKIVNCIARAIRNTDGRAVKFEGCIHDITRERSLEDDLKAKVDELNQSNRELEEFAFVASHDLQEPLRKITTFSGRLYEKYKDLLNADGANNLTRMINAAENMRNLINDLLEFSRISNTTQTFEKVSLNNVLKHVKMDLELVIEETGTAIVCPSLPDVEAVSTQMKQLFANIIANAIKFHKEGIKPVITIELSELSDEEKLQCGFAASTVYYKFMMTDNGIGFEAEYAARIFKVFQRLHGKSEYPGSGIGLAICKKIVEYHHGIIYAENLPDIGARFVFILPQQQQ